MINRETLISIKIGLMIKHFSKQAHAVNDKATNSEKGNQEEPIQNCRFQIAGNEITAVHGHGGC